MFDCRSIIDRQAEKAGIEINGTRPWDIQIYDPRVYRRFVLQGALGLGESYMAGQWDCERLELFFERLLRARLNDFIGARLVYLRRTLQFWLLNMQTRTRAFSVARRHYDLSNEFYAAMLDPSMTYTCAYWNDADNLEQAQRAKLDMVCRKLGIREGHKVLDIGCGWGSFARYAAERYGAHVTGVTISRAQVDYANNLPGGLPIDIRFQDYRDVEGRFDRIVSLGMFEHVGWRNYRTYWRTLNRLLKDDGLALVQTIGHRHSTRGADPWVHKYIFPNSSVPSVRQIGNHTEDLLIMEDLHNLGPDYARTLTAWQQNFEANWPRFRDQLGDEFYRMWNYYLMSFTGAFRAHFLQLWQIVFSKPENTSTYRSIRP